MVVAVFRLAVDAVSDVSRTIADILNSQRLNLLSQLVPELKAKKGIEPVELVAVMQTRRRVEHEARRGSSGRVANSRVATRRVEALQKQCQAGK
jgi:hypothetical protein